MKVSLTVRQCIGSQNPYINYWARKVQESLSRAEFLRLLEITESVFESAKKESKSIDRLIQECPESSLAQEKAETQEFLEFEIAMLSEMLEQLDSAYYWSRYPGGERYAQR